MGRIYWESTYISGRLGILFGDTGFVFCVPCPVIKIRAFLARSLQVGLERRNLGSGLLELGVEFVKPPLESLVILRSRAKFM